MSCSEGSNAFEASSRSCMAHSLSSGSALSSRIFVVSSIISILRGAWVVSNDLVCAGLCCQTQQLEEEKKRGDGEGRGDLNQIGGKIMASC